MLPSAAECPEGPKGEGQHIDRYIFLLNAESGSWAQPSCLLERQTGIAENIPITASLRAEGRLAASAQRAEAAERLPIC